MTFNGFISYSHAADNRLAPAVQRGLHRLAKPWHRRRALWIFRDQSGLSVTPALWSSIQKALDRSDYFVLMASPDAARSPWVNREIEHWVATKSADRILPVVTDGHWQWDPARHDFTADSTAVPSALRGAFREEPLYLDLRWARDDRHLSLRHSRFRDAIAQLAAPMHGVSKDDLEGEDVRQHRRAKQLRSGALTTFIVLMMVASLTGGLAIRNAQRATTATAEALRQQQSAFEQRGYAVRSAEEAKRQQGLAEQQQARARAAAEETKRQERLARQQRALAEQAAVEAGRQADLARDQKALADQASLDAARQERIARDQKAQATRASADATRQQELARRLRGVADQAALRARDQEQLAQRQRELARKWALEAGKQEEVARQQGQIAREQQQRAEEATKQADREQRNAEQQRRIAVGRRLVNQAKKAIDDDPRTALMLGTAAAEIQGDAEARRELAGLVTSTRYVGTVENLRAVTYGPGTVVAAREGADAFSLWNVASPSKAVWLAELDDDGGSDTLAFSPDGKLLAVVGTGGATILWNVANPAAPVRLGPLPGLTGVTSLAFSPDGRTLITGILIKNPPPKNPPRQDLSALWDIADPAKPKRLSTMPSEFSVHQVGFGHDGRTAVVNTEPMQIWDITDLTDPELLSAPAGHPESAMMSSSIRPIAASLGEDRRTVTLWDTTHPTAWRDSGRITVPQTFTSLEFSWDGRMLAVGDRLGRVSLWDVSDPSKATQIDGFSGHDSPVTAVAFRRDGRQLIASGDGGATLWNVAAHGAPTAVADPPGTDGSLLALAFHRDGRSMATAHSDGKAVFWDVSRPDEPVRRATPTIYPGSLNAAAFTPDRRTVVAAGLDQITLTDVTEPERPRALATIHVERMTGRLADQMTAVAFSPDSRMLALGTYNGMLRLWDLADWSNPRLLGSHYGSGSVQSMTFSPDGSTLALASPLGTVSLLDMTDPSKPDRFAQLADGRGMSDDATPVAFTSDGLSVATRGVAANTVVLWSIADRAKVHRVTTVSGLDGTVQSVSLSPDGRTLAGTDDAGMVTMWDIADRTTPLLLATMDAPPSAHTIVAFGTDGHTLAAGPLGGRGRTVTLWDHTALNDLRADPARHACAITGRGLTTDEWTRHIPEMPHRPICAR